MTCLLCQANIEEDMHLPQESSDLGLLFCGPCWKAYFQKSYAASAAPSEESSVDFGEIIEDLSSHDRCIEHNKPNKIFCVQDKQLICEKCIFSGSHKGHEAISLDDALELQETKTKQIDYLTKLIESYSRRLLDTKEASLRDNEEKLLREVNEKFELFIQEIIKRKEEVAKEITNTYRKARNSLLYASPLIAELVGWKESMKNRLASQGLRPSSREDRRLLKQNLQLLIEDTQQIADRFKELIQQEATEVDLRSFPELEVKWGSIDALKSSLCTLTAEDKRSLKDAPKESIKLHLSKEDREIYEILMNYTEVKSSGSFLSVHLPHYPVSKQALDTNMAYSDSIGKWLQLKDCQIKVSLDLNTLDERIAGCMSRLFSRESLSEVQIVLDAKYGVDSKNTANQAKLTGGMLCKLKRLRKLSIDITKELSHDFNSVFSEIVVNCPDLISIHLLSFCAQDLKSYFNKFDVMKNIEEISISNHDLTSFDMIGMCKSLRKLRLQGPINVGNLANLSPYLSKMIQLHEISVAISDENIDVNKLGGFFKQLNGACSLSKVSLEVSYSWLGVNFYEWKLLNKNNLSFELQLTAKLY